MFLSSALGLSPHLLEFISNKDFVGSKMLRPCLSEDTILPSQVIKGLSGSRSIVKNNISTITFEDVTQLLLAPSVAKSLF
jgi:hypothetical protein